MPFRYVPHRFVETGEERGRFGGLRLEWPVRWRKTLSADERPEQLAASVLQHHLGAAIRAKLREAERAGNEFWPAYGLDSPEEVGRRLSGGAPMRLEEVAIALYALGPDGFPTWEALAEDIRDVLQAAGQWQDVEVPRWRYRRAGRANDPERPK